MNKYHDDHDSTNLSLLGIYVSIWLDIHFDSTGLRPVRDRIKVSRQILTLQSMELEMPLEKEREKVMKCK